MIFNFAIFLCTLIAMEGVGFLAHKYVMHGWGWFLHRSHHQEHLGEPLQWVGAGVAAFGLIYVLVHDGIVHRHWPLRPKPRNRYLQRLYHAHVMHHAIKGRRNSVSFGFLYAPTLATLEKQLREMHQAEQSRDREPSRNDLCGTPINSDLQNG